MRTIEALEDTTLGSGKYAVKKGEAVTILEAVMMRDPAVWGADVGGNINLYEFIADECYFAGRRVQARTYVGRQLREAACTFSLKPLCVILSHIFLQPNAWQPFGNGMRACIVGIQQRNRVLVL